MTHEVSFFIVICKIDDCFDKLLRDIYFSGLFRHCFGTLYPPPFNAPSILIQYRRSVERVFVH